MRGTPPADELAVLLLEAHDRANFRRRARDALCAARIDLLAGNPVP